MLVISDASPLNILIRLDFVDLLPRLFGSVLIPSAVADELRDPRAPVSVQKFMMRIPTWLNVESPTHLIGMVGIDAGEQAAISLALERRADLLLIDDRKGRRAARQMKLKIVGTIGILEMAAHRKLVDLHEALEQLRRSDFSVSDELLDDVKRRFESRQ